MKFEMIDILPVLFLVAVCPGIKLIGVKELNKDYLSLDKALSYRGIFAITIVLYHMSQILDKGMLFHQFTRMGYLAVSVFFFLSGYGLMLSYKRSDKYKNHFFGNVRYETFCGILFGRI